jgi:hypothetical protein
MYCLRVDQGVFFGCRSVLLRNLMNIAALAVETHLVTTPQLTYVNNHVAHRETAAEPATLKIKWHGKGELDVSDIH